MIKLELPPEPPELTAQKTQLTEEYRNKKKAVWREGVVGETIKRVLCEMTHNKCAYSEAPFGENGNPWDVEHFYLKDLYPEMVVEWGNLLPSCKICNSRKGKLDVKKTPIVNPLRDDPKDYLYVVNFRYYPIPEYSEVGKRTIKFLGLNDWDQFVVPRFKEARSVVESVEKLQETMANMDCEDLRVEVLGILESVGPAHNYSAAIATFLLYGYDPWTNLESFLRERGVWDEHLETAKQTLVSIAMPAPGDK